MTITSTLFYPMSASPTFNTFDMTYYLSTHMPLVQENWAPYGLISWKVVNLTHMLDDDVLLASEERREWSVQAILEWRDREVLEKAVKEKGDVVFGDVKKFSSKMPVCFVVGDVIGSWSKGVA